MKRNAGIFYSERFANYFIGVIPFLLHFLPFLFYKLNPRLHFHGIFTRVNKDFTRFSFDEVIRSSFKTTSVTRQFLFLFCFLFFFRSTFSASPLFNGVRLPGDKYKTAMKLLPCCCCLVLVVLFLFFFFLSFSTVSLMKPNSYFALSFLWPVFVPRKYVNKSWWHFSSSSNFIYLSFVVFPYLLIKVAVRQHVAPMEH